MSKDPSHHVTEKEKVHLLMDNFFTLFCQQHQKKCKVCKWKDYLLHPKVRTLEVVFWSNKFQRIRKFSFLFMILVSLHTICFFHKILTDNWCSGIFRDPLDTEIPSLRQTDVYLHFGLYKDLLNSQKAIRDNQTTNNFVQNNQHKS